MVTTVADPLKPTPLSLTESEVQEYQALIAEGVFPPDWFAKCRRAAAEQVFGVGFDKDSKGNPIEAGLGSPQNETANSVAAYERWGRNEPNYEKVLAKKRQALAEANERRRKAASR